LISITFYQSFERLTTLEILEMPQNGTHSRGVEAIANAVVVNQNLKILNLNDNNLKTQAKTIASALKSLKSIETINFGDCLLKRSGCIAICEALNESDVSNVKEIVLSGNEIGGEEAIEALIKCSLRIIASKPGNSDFKLELNNNNFGETGVERLVEALGEKINLNIRYF